MRRRAFIAAAGTLLTAGCSGSDSGSDDGLNPQYREGIAVDSGDKPSIESIDTNISELNTNISTVDLDTSSINFTKTNSTTIDIGNVGVGTGPREKDTPQNEEATKHIEKATTHLETAHKTYKRQAGPGASISDVGPPNEEVNSIDLKAPIQDAISELDKASGPATDGQMVNIVALRDVGLFLFESAKIDEHLVEAFNEFTFGMERIYNESLVQADKSTYRMDDSLATARKLFRPVDRDINEEAMAAYPHLTSVRYERKIRQLDGQIDVLMDFTEVINSLIGGIEALKKGVPKYKSREYEQAYEHLLTASSEIGIASSTFNMVPGGTGLLEATGDHRKNVKTMELVANDLKRGANAQVEDNRLVFFESRRSAEEKIKANETIKQMDTFRNVIY